MVLLHLPRGRGDAREPRGQLAAEAIDRVVRAVRDDGLDGSVGPARKLHREQPAHEGGVGLDLVGVHPAGPHGRSSTPGGQGALAEPASLLPLGVG